MKGAYSVKREYVQGLWTSTQITLESEEQAYLLEGAGFISFFGLVLSERESFFCHGFCFYHPLKLTMQFLRLHRLDRDLKCIHS